MSYSPYLIANYATGLDDRLQPWLSADDAQKELYDGYVYRGTLSKREGYKYFAIGEREGLPYRESRIVHTLTAVPMVGVIDSVNTVFTLAGTVQIARGSVTVTGTVPVQSFTDDGMGGFTGAVGTVDYITGAISITLPVAPTGGTVTVTYSFMPDEPVMMIANFITAANVKEMVVANLSYVNRYNSLSNVLEDISPATPYTGTKFDFYTWLNYPDASSNPRLLFTNNVDTIQQYDGTTVTNYAFTLTGVTTLTASFMVTMKDRLILLRTTQDGTVFPQRIYISGTGASSDIFDTSATGAGFIDISDGTWINGAAFNRDDLIIFTEASVWSMKYTGNDTTPFVLNKIDESRGCGATFSVITYLNRTTAASPRGLIISDGYRVERQDMSIPDFSFNEVSGDNFKLCFAGSVDEDRDHYLIYPPQGQIISKRILVTNYDEDTYAIFRIPLSCMGTYLTAFEIKWTDLTGDPSPPGKGINNWDDLGGKFGSWSAFAFSKGSPLSIGGGHHGEIWNLAVNESEDNPVRIYSITIIDDETIQLVTDWNNFSLNSDDATMGADYIALSGVGGMLEVNDQQYPIADNGIINNNTFNLKVENSSFFSAYTSGGSAIRVIPFSALFKKFNPFASEDKKVRCGWIYMYVDSTGTNLNRNIAISFADQTFPLLITTSSAHNVTTGELCSFFGVGGMTELNGQQSYATRVTPTVLMFEDIDATGYTAYTSGGFVKAPVPAKMSIDVITNDNEEQTQLNYDDSDPYQGSCTNLIFQDGFKKWYKVYINQVGIFIQFRFRNVQAGATINVQATMPGFQPIGRII